MSYSIEIFLSIIGAVLTSGVLSLILFRKQDKRIKEAEAKVQEAQAQTSIVNNYETLLDRYEKTLEKNDKQRAEMEVFHDKRYKFLEAQQKENADRINALAKAEREMKPLLCYDTLCKVRKSNKVS